MLLFIAILPTSPFPLTFLCFSLRHNLPFQQCLQIFPFSSFIFSSYPFLCYSFFILFSSFICLFCNNIHVQVLLTFHLHILARSLFLFSLIFLLFSYVCLCCHPSLIFSFYVSMLTIFFNYFISTFPYVSLFLTFYYFT